MSELVTHRAESGDGLVEFVRFRRDPVASEVGRAVDAEHRSQLVEAEAGVPTEGDHGEPSDHVVVELPSEPASADRRDEPSLLVVAERRRRQAGLVDHLGDVEHGTDRIEIDP